MREWREREGGMDRDGGEEGGGDREGERKKGRYLKRGER